MELFPPNWAEIFAPGTPLLELIARGSALYFGVFVLVRIMPRRTGGELELMDLIFVLLIAEAAAHSFGGYESVADGLIDIAVLMAWDWSFNFLACRVPGFQRLVKNLESSETQTEALAKSAEELSKHLAPQVPEAYAKELAILREQSLAVSRSSCPPLSTSSRFSRSNSARPIRTRGPATAAVPPTRRRTLLIRASSSRGSNGLAT